MTSLKPELKVKGTQIKQRVTALKFGTAVSLKRNNVELWRNGGGTAAIDENYRFEGNDVLDDLKLSNLARKTKKLRLETAFFGDSGGFAAVSLQFYIAFFKAIGMLNFSAKILK